jgi:hypothetical protein
VAIFGRSRGRALRGGIGVDKIPPSRGGERFDFVRVVILPITNSRFSKRR